MAAVVSTTTALEVGGANRPTKSQAAMKQSRTVETATSLGAGEGPPLVGCVWLWKLCETGVDGPHRLVGATLQVLGLAR
ncbi:hypothetical protein NDU88_004033 [Pleurodeles waltl]|uniref:Uncharacterized protein n=1 Tax=Pleurodeles waltl TaxID=8319 RepID=A0AAV7V456_PLEWA|nr:hypothetical protein NDU88_004033 [Pleurodeles waltl]